MSWDSYIDNLVAQSKDSSGTVHVDKAVLFGLDGGALWTSNSHANSLKITPTESANIARCFKNKDFSAFMSSGVIAEGMKYQFLREEDKKNSIGQKEGKWCSHIASKQNSNRLRPLCGRRAARKCKQGRWSNSRILGKFGHVMA